MKTKLLILLGAVAVFVATFAETKTNKVETVEDLLYRYCLTNEVRNIQSLNATNIIVQPDKLIETLRESGSLSNVVNLMVTSGVVCEVRGHKWGSHMALTANAIYYPDGAPPTRECKVCGLVQTQSVGEWR